MKGPDQSCTGVSPLPKDAPELLDHRAIHVYRIRILDSARCDIIMPDCGKLGTNLMRVEKEKFDALLSKLMRTPPEPAKAIETQSKMGKIIPPIQPPKPRKA